MSQTNQWHQYKETEHRQKTCIGYRSNITSIKEISGNKLASEPLNFFIIVIYDLLPTYNFLLPFSDYSFGNGRIGHLHVTDLLNDLMILLTGYIKCLTK